MAKMKQATLVKEISFQLGAVAITVPVNTVVEIDTKEGYCIYNGQHFDIFRDEYSLTN